MRMIRSIMAAMICLALIVLAPVLVAFRRPRSSDEGRWLSCFICPDGRQIGVQIARHEIMLLRQAQTPILAGRSIS